MDSGYGRHSRASTLKLCLMSLTTWTIPKKLALVSRSRPRRWPRGQAKINHFCALPDVGIQERCVRCDAGGRDRHERIVSVRKSVPCPPPDSTQPRKKAKQPASTNEKAHAKRDREAPRTPAGAKVSKPQCPSSRPTPCRRRRWKLLLLRSPLRVRMSNLSMTKAGAEVCLRPRERLGRFLQLPRALRARRQRRAPTPRTLHRMRCKWLTRTRSMSSIARRASSRPGSTISCGCWARRSLPHLPYGSFRE